MDTMRLIENLINHYSMKFPTSSSFFLFGVSKTQFSSLKFKSIWGDLLSLVLEMQNLGLLSF